MKRKSIVLLIAVVFTIASGQCRDEAYQPGAPAKFGVGITPCDMSAAAGMDCEVFVKCLKEFQFFKELDPNGYYPGKPFYVPLLSEREKVKMELAKAAAPTKAAAKKAKPAKKASLRWIKKRATPEQIQKYFFEKHTMLKGETIFSVARKYANARWKNPQTIVWFNPGLKNPEGLREGDVINIPDTLHYFWTIQNGRPYGDRPIAAAVYSSMLPTEIKQAVLTMMSLNENGVDGGKDGYIKNGEVMVEMAEGSLSSVSTTVDYVPDVVCVFDNGAGYYARVYEVKTADWLYIVYDPSVCHNLCWRTEPLINIPPSSYSPPNTPDTTPILKSETPPSAPPVTTDTSWGPGSPTPAEPTSNLINSEELFAWGGHQCPLPAWVDGSNFYGGRFNWFPGSGAFGLNLEVNGWDGYGPQVQWYRYFGFCPAGGISLEWANASSKLTLSADAAWQYDYGYDNNYYTATQKTWFFYPELTYLFMTGNGTWDEGYVSYKADVSHQKVSSVGGVTLTSDPAADKSCFILGNRYFFWNLGTSTPLTLGVNTKVMHLLEDDRFELTLGPVLSINYLLKVGVQYQATVNSKNRYLNGNVIAAVADIDLWNIFKR